MSIGVIDALNVRNSEWQALSNRSYENGYKMMVFYRMSSLLKTLGNDIVKVVLTSNKAIAKTISKEKWMRVDHNTNSR